MGQLRTANKRHKRATLRRQADDSTAMQDRTGDAAPHPISSITTDMPAGI